MHQEYKHASKYKHMPGTEKEDFGAWLRTTVCSSRRAGLESGRLLWSRLLAVVAIVLVVKAIRGDG